MKSIKYFASKYIILALIFFSSQMQACGMKTFNQNVKGTTTKILSHAEISSIEFGHGGGVVGKVHKNVLFPTGALTYNNDTIGEITFAAVDSIYQEVSSLYAITYYKPNNLYNFITIHRDQKSYKYSWNGASPTGVPEDLIRMYNRLKVLMLLRNK